MVNRAKHCESVERAAIPISAAEVSRFLLGEVCPTRLAVIRVKLCVW